ncbi:MmcB family DNA repair protein [Chelatococcus sp. GCM10030263]|uniref:MmcB family DNA repair protein n=1 Tax=Chelatococcus sp. GCM10030263 TaxID=3273387 RepID=UPI003619550C
MGEAAIKMEAQRAIVDPRLVDGRQSPVAARLQRGVRRLLASLGHVSVTELTLASGRRADVVGLAPDGEITIIEIKSCLADFRTDGKWREYHAYCDRFFFAVGDDFPLDVLPEDVGLVMADSYGAAILRPAERLALPGARRKAVMLRFAQAAASRLHSLADPEGAPGALI